MKFTEDPQLELFQDPDESQELDFVEEADRYEAHRKGELAELSFLLWCTENNLEVAEPIRTTLPYDYILRIENEWKTVQVKAAYFHENNNRWHVMVCRPRSPAKLKERAKVRVTTAKERLYEKGDFDLLFTTNGEHSWLVPFYAIRGRACIGLYNDEMSNFKVEKWQGNQSPKS